MSDLPHSLCVKFGTDGIRGVAGQHPIVPDMLFRIATAAAKALHKQNPTPKILLARDTRASGEMIRDALCSGFCAANCKVFDAGVLPTPAASAVTRLGKFDASAMITASHNPYQDNGVKFFNSDGYKFDDEQEHLIERILAQPSEKLPLKKCTAGKLTNGLDLYFQSLHHLLGSDISLKGLKIVLDCANGAASQAAPRLMTSLGAEVISLAAAPDGKNINQTCGSMHPKNAAAEVLNNRAHLGIALDGDADRVVLIDETGAELDGDDILAILAKDMLERNSLSHKTVVATVMSNLGLDEAISALGGKVIRTAVGDKHVIDAMRSGRFSLGGEQSGHIIIGENTPTGDGLLSALHVMLILKEKQKSLQELCKVVKKYPQKLYNIKVASKPPLDQLPLVSKKLSELETSLNNRGRVLLRYSGTENKIRLMLEVPPGTDIDQLATPLLEAINKEIPSN